MALVNYYHEGDTLGGHRDDVESDQSAPIVAISLGCDAIFLLGGDDCLSGVASACCMLSHSVSLSMPFCPILSCPLHASDL